jgi:hypothetical protein
MRTVFVELKVRLIIKIEEGIEVSNVVQEMDYNFESNTEGAGISDMEILEHEVVDSK